MKRLILAVVGLVVVVLVAAVLYLTFGDLGRFRPNIEAAVSRATGREFRIAGEFKPKVLPTPSLVVEGVTLANAEWGTPTPMVSVGKASVEIGLWSLISGPIRVKKLDLQDIAILVEQNASGASNWSMGTAAPTPAPPPDKAPGPGLRELPAIIELASVGNVTVLVKRPEQDDMRGAVAKLDLHTDDAGVIVVQQRDGGGGLGAERWAAGWTGERDHEGLRSIHDRVVQQRNREGAGGHAGWEREGRRRDRRVVLAWHRGAATGALDGAGLHGRRPGQRSRAHHRERRGGHRFGQLPVGEGVAEGNRRFVVGDRHQHGRRRP